MLQPYILVESVQTEKAYSWENHLTIGGGTRLALNRKEHQTRLTRLIVYLEYTNNILYYDDQPKSGEPDYDIRLGISFAIGDWWRSGT